MRLTQGDDLWNPLMLTLISPAKTLDFTTVGTELPTTRPDLLNKSAELVNIMRSYPAEGLCQLMGISIKLGQLNQQRFRDWSVPFTTHNSKAALLAFHGDVYEGLNADSLDQQDLAYAQQHLGILSGLYGLLRPMDLIQPYRLEMGTALKNPLGKTLYQFWGSDITDLINFRLKESRSRWIVNLASNEYFKAVKPKALAAPIVHPVFKDESNGRYKVISFYAKKARGMMARYIIKNRIDGADKIKSFSDAGYQYDEGQSSAEEWVFTRSVANRP